MHLGADVKASSPSPQTQLLYHKAGQFIAMCMFAQTAFTLYNDFLENAN